MTRFRAIRQHDSTECGATCIRMVASHYGKRYTSETLQRICVPGPEGISLMVMRDAAEYLGFSTICLKGKMDLLHENRPFPCILHWNGRHFVVLYDIDENFLGRRIYRIADPATGLVALSEEKFRHHWMNGQENGIVMKLNPTDVFYQKADDKLEDSYHAFSFIFDKLKRYRFDFLQVLLGILLGCFVQFCLPFLTQAIVDKGINRQDINIIYLILIGQLTLVLSKTAIEFVRRWLLLHISMRFNLTILSDFFIKLAKLPMRFFDTKMTGDIMQRISDHSRIEQFITGQSLNVIFSGFTLLVFLGVLAYYNLSIFFIFLVGSLLYAVWIAFFLKKRKELDYQRFEHQSRSYSKIIQLVDGMQEIKLQNCERRYRWEWEGLQVRNFMVKMKSLSLEQTQGAGGVLINEVKNILITVYAATSVISGNLTLGMMLAIQYIIGQLNSPVEQLVQFLHGWQDAKISMDRMAEIHTRKNETPVEGKVKDIGGSKDIHISHLTFQYEGKHSPKVLDDVSIIIPHGKVTAIVGSSGSGKTTLIKLLLGYYDFYEGRIMLGNAELRDVNLDWWRDQCGVVMQDGMIFTDTIAHNIAIADDVIQDNQLRYAANMACIDKFADSLPQKYDTIIGKDGMGLSQGQKQRLLIARAVYKNPSFLFFDEATNSLDTVNERKIVENLNQFYRDKTVLVVAHRMSTVRNADNIIVMDKGRIMETGNHDTLIEKHGYYYNLVYNQLG
ncbi:MAG: peptidase domain-containing ABC transporter [Bacteroidaceae bacterium]|nr:peptidase domain-containing ABC transporter [Bacteroidaceae bacterium]